MGVRDDATSGRLRVADGAGQAPPAGGHPLGLAAGRDGVLEVPPGRPAWLVVALHGHGGSGARMGDLLGPAVTARGGLLLAPDARGATWDALRTGLGPDVEFVGRALSTVLAAFDVPASRRAVAGFSDGGSYALALGLANGDVFGNVLAWAPGFVPAATLVGRPRVFVAHGTADKVLDIDRCSRRIVPALRRSGYDDLRGVRRRAPDAPGRRRALPRLARGRLTSRAA